jgi:class 3 adenylate cyclase
VTPRVSSIQRIAAQVDPAAIDFAGRTSPEGAVTVMFTDIEGSSEMVERLGDEAWVEILRAHNALVRATLARFDGIEVKAQGDGFMLAFQSSRMGLGCAIEMQRALEEYAIQHPLHAPRVRAGLHSGSAIQEESDFFGLNVILAARIADRARGGEILVSQQLREFVHADDEVDFLEGQELTLKGLAGRHMVYPVAWRAPGDRVRGSEGLARPPASG